MKREPLWIRGVVLVVGLLAVLPLAGCATKSTSKIEGPKVEAQRYERGPIEREIIIRPRAAQPKDTAPFWSPDEDGHGIAGRPTEPPVGDGFWDVANRAAQAPDSEIHIVERYGQILDASGKADGGSVDTSADEVAQNAKLQAAPVDIAPMGSKSRSGSRQSSESSFDITGKVAAQPVALMVIGALCLIGAALSFKFSKQLAVGLAAAGGAILAFAFYPELGVFVLLGGMAVAVVAAIIAARKGGTQQFALASIVKGIEDISDKNNPESLGRKVKAALDANLDATTLAKIDAAIDPIKSKV